MEIDGGKNLQLDYTAQREVPGMLYGDVHELVGEILREGAALEGFSPDKLRT